LSWIRGYAVCLDLIPGKQQLDRQTLIRGLALVELSPVPRPEEWRRLSREERRARRADRSTHWADLGDRWRWYGSGTSHEDAIRSAARRWRVEPIGSGAERNASDHHLP
jgi:hypothetical protein